MNAYIYARVATVKQAKEDLSIPDQLRQMRDWCSAHGYKVIAEHVEPGASATDGKRPAFQQMLAAATAKGSPVNCIVVHSFSRFYRDHIKSAICERDLRRHGVHLISITQETPDDTTGEMIRGIIDLFDELGAGHYPASPRQLD